jgi:hypothetical protein
VAHVELTGGIGQHLEHVVLGLGARGGLGGVEAGLRGPARLPAGLDLGGFATSHFGPQAIHGVVREAATDSNRKDR